MIKIIAYEIQEKLPSFSVNLSLKLRASSFLACMNINTHMDVQIPFTREVTLSYTENVFKKNSACFFFDLPSFLNSGVRLGRDSMPPK